MASLTKPYNFSAGGYAVAAQVNADFDTLYSWVNQNAIWSDASVAFTGLPTGPDTDPTAPNHLARKAYVDSTVNGRMPFGGKMCAGTVAGTTNAQGYLTITFPITFVVGPVVVASIGDDIGDFVVTPYGPTTTGFGTHVYSVSGASLANTAVRINYVAAGN